MQQKGEYPSYRQLYLTTKAFEHKLREVVQTQRLQLISYFQHLFPSLPVESFIPIPVIQFDDYYQQFEDDYQVQPLEFYVHPEQT